MCMWVCVCVEVLVGLEVKRNVNKEEGNENADRKNRNEKDRNIKMQNKNNQMKIKNI